MGSACSVSSTSSVSLPENINNKNIETDLALKTKRRRNSVPNILLSQRKKNKMPKLDKLDMSKIANKSITNYDENYNEKKLLTNTNRDNIPFLKEKINSLEADLMDMTIRFAKHQVDIIDNQKESTHKIKNLKKKNAKLWSSLIESKHPEFCKKTNAHRTVVLQKKC